MVREEKHRFDDSFQACCAETQEAALLERIIEAVPVLIAYGGISNLALLRVCTVRQFFVRRAMLIRLSPLQYF